MKSPSTLLPSRVAFVLLLGVTLACSRFPSLRTPERPQDKGGVQLILMVKAEPSQLDQSIELTKSVIQNRCDQLNIFCKMQRENGDQIMLRFSSSIDPTRVKNVLLSQGLEICAVISEPSPAPVRKYATRDEAGKTAGTDDVVLPYLEKEDGASANPEVYVLVKREPLVTGQDVRSAAAVSYIPDGTDYQINFQLRPEAAQRFGDWTGKNINNYVAVVYNKKVQTIAYIRSQILDSGEITGRYNKEQAEDMARVLTSGNLPAPIEVLREETYKP